MHIVYDQRLSLGADEYISLAKTARVFERCFDKSRDTVIAVRPVSLEQIRLAHDPEWAAEVFECREMNGFGNSRREVIEQALYANGALLRAAEIALLLGIGFAPVGGFQHAGYDFNGKFCTFNGLIIALQVLKAAEKIKSALILDFDGHYGNGTADIISRLNLDWVIHMTRHHPFDDAVSSINKATAAIQSCPDIVIFLAGADSHIDHDPEVGYFTDEQWKMRDRAIFKTCNQLKLPVVWTLCGGYSGEKTIDLHASTFQAACEIYSLPEFLKHRPD